MNERSNIVGTERLLHAAGDKDDGLYVRVTIIEMRWAYGRVDVLVTPTHKRGGEGQAWIDLSKLQAPKARR